MRPAREREYLDYCGTRPVRGLALLVAQITPVPTLAEMRAMVAAGETWLRAPDYSAEGIARRRARKVAYNRAYRARLRAAKAERLAA
jgi:hypothetical protein